MLYGAGGYITGAPLPVQAGRETARIRTPLDIALRMGAPFLVERSIDPSEEGLGPALLMHLLIELPSSATESPAPP